jgi:hypothetical protein
MSTATSSSEARGARGGRRSAHGAALLREARPNALLNEPAISDARLRFEPQACPPNRALRPSNPVAFQELRS